MSKQNHVILLGVLLLLVLKVNCQTNADSTWIANICVEGGFNSYSADVKNIDKIRASISYYESNSENVSCTFFKTYTGVKYSLTNKKQNFAFAGGLRYVHTWCNISPDDGSSSNFFYFLINSSGTTTEYLRIEEIRQNCDYLAIPIEVKYYLLSRDVIKLYLKMGFEYAFELNNSIEADFYDASANNREGEINDKFADKNSHYSAINGAGGFEFGRKDKITFCIELNAPSLFISKNVSALCSPNAGVGVQVSLQIPLKNLKSKKNENQ